MLMKILDAIDERAPSWSDRYPDDKIVVLPLPSFAQTLKDDESGVGCTLAPLPAVNVEE